MPLYEFKCERCGEEKEDFVKVGTEILSCNCGGPMKKVMSLPNFVLKGNCWYKDHYGLKKETKKGGKENA